jgi:hypothetical protein
MQQQKSTENFREYISNLIISNVDCDFEYRKEYRFEGVVDPPSQRPVNVDVHKNAVNLHKIDLVPA